MGRFDSRASRPIRGFGDFIKWKLLDPLSARRAARRAPFETPRRENGGELIRELDASLTWIGHASFVLKLGGRLVAIDPVWSQRVGTLRRMVPAGVPLEAISPMDYVLVSHNHYDHLDLPTLRRIGDSATYITPIGNGRILRRAGVTKIIELDWWQTHEGDSLSVTLVPARHWSMRTPWDRNEALWGGFVIRSEEGVAYHSGDTAFFEGFREIGSRIGPIDWAMLPIGAYAPRWFMHPQHLDPEEAGLAFEMLGAQNFVAMHWGTFKLTDEPMGEPPERIRDYWQQKGICDSRLWLLDVGETRVL